MPADDGYAFARSSEDRESSVRWQQITIAQLGYTVNLVLAFATASVGFAFSFVREPSFTPNCAIRIVFGTSLCLLLASVGVGLLCACNRLWDFRMTAAIARDRENWLLEKIDEPTINLRLSPRRDKVKASGGRTWSLFYGQIWCFVGGVILLIVTFADIYWPKI